jgi:hypothetical protein
MLQAALQARPSPPPVPDRPPAPSHWDWKCIECGRTFQLERARDQHCRDTGHPLLSGREEDQFEPGQGRGPEPAGQRGAGAEEGDACPRGAGGGRAGADGGEEGAALGAALGASVAGPDSEPSWAGAQGGRPAGLAGRLAAPEVRTSGAGADPGAVSDPGSGADPGAAAVDSDGGRGSRECWRLLHPDTLRPLGPAGVLHPDDLEEFRPACRGGAVFLTASGRFALRRDGPPRPPQAPPEPGAANAPLPRRSLARLQSPRGPLSPRGQGRPLFSGPGPAPSPSSPSAPAVPWARDTRAREPGGLEALGRMLWPWLNPPAARVTSHAGVAGQHAPDDSRADCAEQWANSDLPAWPLGLLFKLGPG